MATRQWLPLQYITVMRSFPIKHWLVIDLYNNDTGEHIQLKQDTPEHVSRRINLWRWPDYLPPVSLTPGPTTEQPYTYDMYKGELFVAIETKDVHLSGTTRMRIPNRWGTIEDVPLKWGEVEDYSLTYGKLEELG